MGFRDRDGWSLPLLPMLFTLAIIAALIWGWHIFLYVALSALAITLLVWLYDKIRHLRGCPDCLKAKQFLQSKHREWDVWIDARSHRATEAERSVVAVFYRKPGQHVRPPLYKLFSVLHGSEEVTELPVQEALNYAIRNYK
jgi:hypothetical protein